MNDSPAGQPDEAKVEQRHRDLAEIIRCTPGQQSGYLKSLEESAKLLAASEARAVAEQTHTLSLHLTEASRMVAELRERLELLESQHETRLAAFEEYKKLREAQLAKANAALREAQKDSARLDWLNAQAKPGRERNHIEAPGFHLSWYAMNHGDIRAAINAAALPKEGAK